MTLLQDQIRDPDEFPHRWGIPVLGQIAKFNTSHTNIITQAQPRSPDTTTWTTLDEFAREVVLPLITEPVAH